MAIGSRFVGTIDQMAAHNVFALPPHVPDSGITLGNQLFSGAVFEIDPAGYQNAGYIEGKSIVILGARDVGKTTLAKLIAYYLSADRIGEADRMRISIDDTRRNFGVPEYAGLARALGSEEVDLSKHRINFLDPKMGSSFSDQLGTVIQILEHVGGEPLVRYEPLGLQVALSLLMDKYSQIATPEVLVHLLNRVNASDLATYQATFSARLESQLSSEAQLLLRLGDSESDTEKALSPTNVNEADFLQDAGRVYAKLMRLLNGDYSNIFGGDHTLSEVLNQRVVALDYTGIDISAFVLVQSLVWRWRTSALRRGDTRYLSNLEIHDENYGMWEHPIYATNMYSHLKKIRATGEIVVRVQHRLDDSYAVGSAGSEVREKAVNSLNETDMWFIGRQPQSAIPRLKERLGLDDWVCKHITQLGKGEFYFKMGQQPPVPFKLYLDPIIRRAMTETNMANDYMLGLTDRVSVPS